MLCVMGRAEVCCVMGRAEVCCVLGRAEVCCVMGRAEVCCVMGRAEVCCVMGRAEVCCSSAGVWDHILGRAIKTNNVVYVKTSHVDTNHKQFRNMNHSTYHIQLINDV